VSIPQPTEFPVPVTATPTRTDRQGRWVWGAAILAIACIAQSALWAKWWEDPTYFAMSVLFVWPAALFSLGIWWTFFSGWSWRIRLGLVGAIAAMVVSFFSLYRLEWDGGMIPRRFILRSKPTPEEVARQYRRQQLASAKTVGNEAKGDEAQPADRLPLVASEGDWPGFRGPERDGIVRNGSLRRDWQTAPPKQIWRHPLGRAWSSFAVVGSHAFTQEQRDEYECVIAYDMETGSELWVHQDKTILSIVDANGGPGPHATPQFEEGFLYTLGGTGVLNCLDAATGKRFWSTNILKDAGDGTIPAANIEWGLSGSPLIVDDLVIVVPGGTAKEGGIAFDQGVAAYDKKTGQRVWAAGKRQASYGSPRTETLGGKRQLLIPNADGLSGHSLDSGKELWFFPLANPPKVNSSMPWLLEDGSLLFGTGYGIGSVRLDITGGDDQEWVVKQRWQTNRFRPKFNDFFVRDGHAYGLDDGTLACLDIENGKIKWKSGRYGYGQLLLVDDIILIITEDGDLLLVPAKPEKPEAIATFKVFDSGFCWNHPVLVRGKLLVRNAVEAVCLDVNDGTKGE
jgi:outer membrane protein assembly factor BamB